MIPEHQLAEMEARANAATPGPWKRETGLAVSRIVYADGKQGPVSSSNHEVELDLMAAARQDVPALIAAYRELQAEIRGLATWTRQESDKHETLQEKAEIKYPYNHADHNRGAAIAYECMEEKLLELLKEPQ